MTASEVSRSKAMSELLDFHGNGQAAATPGEAASAGCGPNLRPQSCKATVMGGGARNQRASCAICLPVIPKEDKSESLDFRGNGGAPRRGVGAPNKEMPRSPYAHAKGMTVTLGRR